MIAIILLKRCRVRPVTLVAVFFMERGRIMENVELFEKTSPTKLFFLVAIPGAIGMLASALFQLIDGAFVGQLLGQDAFAALNLAMPLVVINFAVADLVGVGSSVLIGIKLGQKANKSASNIFTSSCILIFLLGILFGGLMYLFAPTFIDFMGSEGKIAHMATQYLRVYALCAPVTIIVFAVDNYLRICGKVKYSMVVNILMSSACVLFEFLFLFVFKFGIWGAALGTCTGFFVAALIAFFPFIRGKLPLKFTKPKITTKLVVNIASNGSASFLNNIAGRITAIIMNIFLLKLGGAVAVSAYGVLMFADGFVQPILYGLCDSLQPAVSYNWGAKRYDRVKQIEKRCYIIGAIFSCLMTLVMFFCAKYVTKIFVKSSDVELFELSIHAIKLFSFAYLVRWISFVTQSYMSAVGKAGYATMISFATAFIVPVIFIFAFKFMKLDGLWLNFPFTSIVSAILSIVLLIKFKKSMKFESIKENIETSI